MPQLAHHVQKVRSKNAGPFWITVDIFCGGPEAYETVVKRLDTRAVAALFHTPLQTLKRFDIPTLYVIKFSFPRPAVQGTPEDRDLHGASFGALMAELEI